MTPMREVMQMALAVLEYYEPVHSDDRMYEAITALREALSRSEAAPEVTQPEPEPVDYPTYHYKAMGCGLEDRGITDRYEAMRYGWDEAIESVFSEGPLYLAPPAPEVPEGWKLVPIEPTPAMLEAGNAIGYMSINSGKKPNLKDYFEAMLAAAPEYKGT